MAAVLDSVRAFFMPSAFAVDAENPGDVVARELLLDRVMGPGRRRKSSEKIRRGRVPAAGLALVARDRSGHVIGTVRLWNVDAGVDGSGKPVPALLLGPLAVDSEISGKGIGSALMRSAIQDAKKLGHGAILLVGDSAYYERFGFSAEKAQTLMMPGPFERNRFLALELKDQWLDAVAGVVVPTGRKLSEPGLARAA